MSASKRSLSFFLVAKERIKHSFVKNTSNSASAQLGDLSGSFPFVDLQGLHHLHIIIYKKYKIHCLIQIHK